MQPQEAAAGVGDSACLQDRDALATLESQSLSNCDEERLDRARQEHNLCFGIVGWTQNKERVRNLLNSFFHSVNRTGLYSFLTRARVTFRSTTSETVRENRIGMATLLCTFPNVPASGNRLSQRQFLSVKQPLPTEIQLRITATAQPNSPVKKRTSSTRIASTARLKAILRPFYTATSTIGETAHHLYRMPNVNRPRNFSSRQTP